MHGLCECHKNGRDAQLMVCKIFDDVCVKSKHAEFVCAHDTREELHHDDLVVERETLVIPIEQVVQFFGKCLWIM